MTKVAINTCFGGFGLSNDAFEMLMDRKGIEWEKMDDKMLYGGYHYYRKDGDPQKAVDSLWERDFCEDRTDPDLIAVIEKLGELSYGEFAILKIVEIPDGISWHIHDYDGCEFVAEDHRIWR